MPAQEMVIDGILYLTTQALLDMGYTESYLKKVMHEYRTGKSSSYENIPDPNDARKKLIAYRSIPAKAIAERGMPSEEQLRAKLSTQNIEDAVTAFAGLRHDQAINFFKAIPGTYPHAQELAAQACWLLFLAHSKPATAKALGCGSVEELHTKAIELTRQKSWPWWKVNSTQVLSRKIKPFKTLFKKPLSGNYTDAQFEQALTSLIPGTVGNKNSQKLTEEQEACIFTLYANSAKLNETQVYAMYLNIAAKKITAGEWTDKSLVSESTIKNFLRKPEIKQAYYRARHGTQAYRNTYEIITRRKPASTSNGLWVIDGTPVHRYYMIGDTAYARLNVFVILDAHSWCVVGFYVTETENTDSVIGALRAACQLSNYLPHEIMYDMGSANLSYQAQQCITKISRVHKPTMAGNARAKIVEPFFRHFNNQVLRFRPGFTHSPVMGNNINSKPNPEALSLLVKSKKLPASKEQAIKELHEDFSIWNHKAFNGSKSPIEKYRESVNTTLDFQRPLTRELLVDAFYTMPGKLKQTKGIDKDGQIRQFKQFIPTEYTYTNGGVQIQLNNRKYDYLIDDAEVNKWLIGHKVLVKYDPQDMGNIYLYQNTEDGPRPLRYNNSHLVAVQPNLFAMAIMDRQDGEAKELREHLDRKKVQAQHADELATNYKRLAIQTGTFMEIKAENAYPKEVINAAFRSRTEQLINGDRYRLITDLTEDLSTEQTEEKANPSDTVSVESTGRRVDRWDL